MKRSFLSVAFILLLAQVAFCQYSTALDQLNGFKIFKFHQTSTSIKNIRPSRIKYTVQQKNVSHYDYIGDDIADFNGIKISSIALDFYNDKLYQIRVAFGTIEKAYSSDEYVVVQNALVNNFGISYLSTAKNPIESMTTLNSNFWTGKNVLLHHIRFDLGESKYGSQYNSITGYMLFTETNLKARQQADELE